MQSVRLELEDGTVIDNPNGSEIADALRRLDQDDNTFAILVRTEMTYMQTATTDGGFVLEHQVEGLGQHYRCVERDLSMERVVDAFISYAQGTGDWRRDFEWERIDLP